MTPLQWAQLALGIVKFANWAAAKVDQATWKRIGYQQAMADQMNALQKRVGIGREIVAQVEALPDDDLDAELRGDK